ncbi:GNAT family N-acetyltransferase [Ferrimonas pelagia]|uniref:N-acetyltransferase domain-containing protein n=1 Tax=Ferrimonas pelagia TaxID=1177826 RepID=A0ABP9EUI0_9GAMM
MFEPSYLDLPKGTPVVIRPICPNDAPALQRGMMALSATSRYLRFHMNRGPLTEKELYFFTHCDQQNHLAFVMFPVAKPQELIGVCRCIRDKANSNQADMAITIADQWQKQGAGSLLAKQLRKASLVVGITRWTAFYLATNRGISKLLIQVAKLTAVKMVGQGELIAYYQLVFKHRSTGEYDSVWNGDFTA